MLKIKILPGCISCGTCEVVCPEVFKVSDVSHLKKDADLEQNKEKIKEAAQMCPVGVIEVEE
ncbi:ferredoxin [Candidatus Dependentiae bacterium]|nr:ferredoxin [Candidatus Dependentiae bacterium]